MLRLNILALWWNVLHDSRIVRDEALHASGLHDLMLQWTRMFSLTRMPAGVLRVTVGASYHHAHHRYQ